MNRLSLEKRTQIISALVEGNSIRSTCRMTGTAKRTVTRLLAEVGAACHEYQDRTLVRLESKRIECDEIWSFCYAKGKNVPEQYKNTYGYGSIWTWVAIDADTKLVPCWYVGDRGEESAYQFMANLEPRLKNKVQLTTDGWVGYPLAIQSTFGTRVDYGMVEKQYGTIVYKTDEGERRYSPRECIGTVKNTIRGTPNPDLISTSYIERQNLTMRMGMRRFTRLTNGFSKKVHNLEMAVALHFMYYNFCRPHQSLNRNRALGMTPAMASGVADQRWEIEDIVSLLR